MYKKIVIHTLLFLATIALLFIKETSESDLASAKSLLLDMKHTKTNIDNFANTIRTITFSNDITQYCDNADIKHRIKTISKNFSFQKIKMKHDITQNDFIKIANINLQFVSLNEKDIYKFFNVLHLTLANITNVRSIVMRKLDEKSIFVDVNLSVYFWDSTHIKNFQINKVKKYELPNICIFNIDKPNIYQLLCTVNNSSAYIGNAWHNTGDKIDKYVIEYIGNHYIKLKTHNVLLTINTGECFESI